MQPLSGCVRADVAKLVDALVLEASAERHVSSSLTVRTTLIRATSPKNF